MAALLAGACLALSGSASAAVTADNILNLAALKLASLQSDVDQGKRTGDEVLMFKNAILNFESWVNGTARFAQVGRMTTNEMYLAFGQLGEVQSGTDHGLQYRTRVYPLVPWFGDMPNGVYVSFGSANIPEAKYFYVIGKAVSEDVISVDPQDGAFTALTQEQYLQFQDELGLAEVPGDEIDARILQGQIDTMLTAYAQQLGLPTKDTGKVDEDFIKQYLPYIIAGVLLFIILVVVLVLVLRPHRAPAVPSPTSYPGTQPVGVNPGYQQPPMNPGFQQPPVVSAPSPQPAVVPSVPVQPPRAPDDGTVLLCRHCGAQLRDGECPNGCEECPSCGSLLTGGACPNGHTILRCPTCGKILRDGECPNGHGAKPLSLGGSDASMAMSPFSLEVVEAPVSHRHDRCELPETVVIGRDFREATGAYIQLRFADAAQRQSCSRTYVKLAYLADKNAVRVTLIATNTSQFAIVNGRRLSRKGDAAEMTEGGVLELNPGYRLKLVRA